MKSIIAILGGLILVMMGVYVIMGVNGFRAKDFTAVYGGVTEAGGTGLITLTQPLWQDDTTTVSLTSTEPGDYPLANAYNKQNRALTIIGLDSNSTRVLTITYSISNLTNYPLADMFGQWTPAFFIIGGIGLITGGVVNAFRR